MSIWDDYPHDYRAREVKQIVSATVAGECVSLIGLSGAGKSNLMGYLAHTQPNTVFVDVNRLRQRTPTAFFNLMRAALADTATATDELTALQRAVETKLRDANRLTFLLDLSRLLNRGVIFGEADQLFFNNLRSVRDAFKFQLTYVTATRHPLPLTNELAELFQAHLLYLGAFSESDARWNVRRYAARKALNWDERVAAKLIELARGYPSFLRAACEAQANGAALAAIPAHPAVQARLKEFWEDHPTDEELRQAGLLDHPWLKRPVVHQFDTAKLTAKENLLLEYFIAHANHVCEKDDLIRAVWAEDKTFERGVRDDSLAQLVRRLREKIEPDAAHPQYIHTVPGRGYRFSQ